MPSVYTTPRKFDGKRELRELRAPVKEKRKLAELSCDALLLLLS